MTDLRDYVPTSWRESGMTEQNKVDGLNNLESIYSLAVAYMTAMVHSDIYTIAEADARYYRTGSHPSGRSDTGEGCGINAATCGGYTLDQILGGAFPEGSIVMFGAGAIPAGLLECDGENGTEDMRGYIPRGSGNGIVPGSYGGSNAATPTAPSFTSADHTLLDNEIPSHSHTYYDRTNISHYAGSTFVSAKTLYSYITRTTATTEPGGALARTAHNHPGSTFTWAGYKDESGTSHTGALDIRPACRAVKFLERRYGI